MNLLIKFKIPVEIDGFGEYVKEISRKLDTDEKEFKIIKILSKELNAADKEQFYYNLSAVVQVDELFKNIQNLPLYTEKPTSVKSPKHIKDRPIIIGFGPAGMFAALELIEYGIKPIIFERGKKLEERHLDIQGFINKKVLNEESNIQFGEGGAGTYSDGKLFSRMRNSEHVSKVLDTFIRFGAPEDISYVSKPHLGTDVLCKVVKNIREFIIQSGGEINYSSKFTDIVISNGKALAVVINGKKEYLSSKIYLAIGHSARDTFEMMNKKGIKIEQKPIAVGVRIEHPVEIIDQLKYGDKYKGSKALGAATYSFNYSDKKIGRSVSAFCMCPGGEIVNASSQNGMLVLNGMSYSDRASEFSNAALIVKCNSADYGSAGPLAGIEFQKTIERKAFAAGGGDWTVPAQNLLDFISGRISSKINNNSCIAGTKAANLKDVFPEFVSNMLLAAFNKWKEDYPSYFSEYAVLMAAETRASCPLKFLRNEKYGSVNTENLYPIGEGSGYTGGITSSAADAIKAVEKSIEV